MKLHLTKRLSAVANFVSEGAVLADIGSDHAFLPCYLAQNKRIKKAYAGEIIEGPLNQSRKCVVENGLEKYVFPILSNGLENIPDDVTDITIAGMGAYTVLDILNAYPNKVRKCQRIIVQANSHMELIREYISNNQFMILDEDIIYDKGKYYEICVFNTHIGRILSEQEIKYGPILIEKQSDTFVRYYSYQIQIKQQVLDVLETTHPKYQKIFDEIEELKRVIKQEKTVLI